MNIYTKHGDKGNTTLKNIAAISKDDRRIHLLGAIDELNSGIGILKSLEIDLQQIDFYETIQKNLMTIMAGIADNYNTTYRLKQEQVEVLEQEIDKNEEKFPREKKFVLPGKSFYTAQMDMVRTLTRRCERQFVGVSKVHMEDEMAGRYLNRLSDYFYVLARYKDYCGEDLISKILKEVLKEVKH